MSLALSATCVSWLLGGCLIAILLEAVVAVRAYTKSRHAPYYILREQARSRSIRAVRIILLLLASLVGVALLHQ